MKYLVRKSGNGPAHYWNGQDTACRMASTGGLTPRKYVVRDSSNGRPICQMCQSVSRRADKQKSTSIDGVPINDHQEHPS